MSEYDENGYYKSKTLKPTRVADAKHDLYLYDDTLMTKQDLLKHVEILKVVNKGDSFGCYRTTGPKETDVIMENAWLHDSGMLWHQDDAFAKEHLENIRFIK